MIGQLLAGHYKVLEVLGEGGFGQTYIVEDIHLPGKPNCVLKHLKTTSTDPESLETARRLFQKEADTLQQLGNHSQIPRLLAYFEENQQFYLVQEFIEGHPLSRELPLGKRWTETQTIEMLIEVLSILEFVHAQGVIHRDIKPDNLIRRVSDNKLVLIDFGAIKQLRSQTAMGAGRQNITIIVGTRGYMPSEQIRRLPRPSSDIYALGMMGIQALTGVYPHELQDDPNTGEILWQDLTSVSPEFAAILAKMTRYHFKERYQTASEVLTALRELSNSSNSAIASIESSTSSLHQLTLEWVEDGQVKYRTILEKQQSKNPGKIRIGRDPEQCDIVLPDPTISGLHVEIFFHSPKQRFYLRNLRQQNPPIIDGQLLLAGEMPLAAGSTLRLGQQNFRVREISCKQYPSGYTPMDYSKCFAITLASAKPAPKTIRISQIKKAEDGGRKITSVSPIVVPASIAPKRIQPRLKVGTAVAVSAIAGIFLLNTGNLNKSKSQQNFILQQPQLCRVVSPSGGKLLAKLRSEPQTEIGAMKQLNLGEKVLFMKVRGDFVQVKLADGTQGWVFGDDIQRCERTISKGLGTRD
ncbi:MAG: protein kinase [Chlorogloeopsis fritschii C42_A2020_084]|uniref:protein kinase domain-containing protein n=1 Tax=Chlorogloeopsis fritschii TaxID=1124 RepID=UPI001A100FF4|nr:protein kinase [Chlorogloeopsis fritschii]MBF2008212.1 protein kinase [Chlorogloeopsis fritschii C42_A2020_084]